MDCCSNRKGFNDVRISDMEEFIFNKDFVVIKVAGNIFQNLVCILRKVSFGKVCGKF